MAAVGSRFLRFRNLFVNSSRSVIFNRPWCKRIDLCKRNAAHHHHLNGKLCRPREEIKLLLTGAIIIPVLLADSSEKEKMDIDSLLNQADKHYKETDYKKAYNLLMPHKDEDNDEVLWRLARAMFEMAKFEKTADERNKLHEEALTYVEKALKINEINYNVHKWMAILIDSVNEAKGVKARITDSEKAKFHIMKATEINPSDPTNYYMLGVWCFSFADLPWYQRKIASVIFATPPTSSYEEALEAFSQAEKVSPKFYSMNLLMLGKTYMRMGNSENAIRFLLEAKNYPLITEDDKQAQKEALELLKSLGVE